MNMNNKNGYKLTKNWFDWCLENRELNSPTLTALYLYIVERCNSLGWKKKFGIPTEHTMYILAIGSYNTYKKHLQRLNEIGFIEIYEKSKNQFSSNIIGLSNFDEPSDKALDEPSDKALDILVTEQVTSLLSHNKTIKQENNKTIKQEKKDTCLSFDDFWNMYDKKVGKKQSVQQYKKVSEKNRMKILKALPNYLKFRPDQQYRKNPYSYLKDEHWNDEINVSAAAGGPMGTKPRVLNRVQD